MTGAFYVNEDGPTRSATVHQTGAPAMSPSESGHAMGNGAVDPLPERFPRGGEGCVLGTTRPPRG